MISSSFCCFPLPPMVDVCFEFRRSVVGFSVDEVWRRLLACCVRFDFAKMRLVEKWTKDPACQWRWTTRALIGSPPDCEISFLYWVLRRNPWRRPAKFCSFPSLQGGVNFEVDYEKDDEWFYCRNNRNNRVLRKSPWVFGFLRNTWRIKTGKQFCCCSASGTPIIVISMQKIH